MDYLILFALFGVLPIWASIQIAKKKNIDTLWPVILTFLFSWLGFVFVLLMSERKRPELRRPLQKHEQRMNCPTCAESIPTAAKICHYCKTPITPEDRPATARPVIRPATRRFRR